MVKKGLFNFIINVFIYYAVISGTILVQTILLMRLL